MTLEKGWYLLLSTDFRSVLDENFLVAARLSAMRAWIMKAFWKGERLLCCVLLLLSNPDRISEDNLELLAYMHPSDARVQCSVWQWICDHSGPWELLKMNVVAMLRSKNWEAITERGAGSQTLNLTLQLEQNYNQRLCIENDLHISLSCINNISCINNKRAVKASPNL